MKPAPFEMYRPRALAEALDLLERHGDAARLIAGGQSLVPMMNFRVVAPSILIELTTVADMAGIRRDGDVIRIGATTRQQALLESDLIREAVPLLAAAMPHIGHYATRSRGTVGGSLANADPSSELALVAVTLGADVTLTTAGACRTIAARDFFLGTMTTALVPSEILTEIAFPIAPRGSRVAFRERARRRGDFAIVAAAAQLSPHERILQVGIGALAPVPLTCSRVEAAFAAGDLSATLDDTVAAELAAVDVMANVHVGESYRRRLAAVCLADCLRDVMP